MMNRNVTVLVGDWLTYGKDASAIRYEVFVQEQAVPEAIELDAEDPLSVHAVAYDVDGTPVGTGRLLRNAHIGRMAVRAHCRGSGVGSRLLVALVDEARRRCYLEVALAAQLHARKFYEAHGFVAEGDVFLDAGIEHVTMRHSLTA